MKYYFFVNPVAGQGKHFAEMTEKIRSAMEELNIPRENYGVYKTEAIGDGETKARLLAEKLVLDGLIYRMESFPEEDASLTQENFGEGEHTHARHSRVCAARFYACGGDGTANEIINGVMGYSGVSVGIIPIGTGNDTVRNFPEAGDFLDIKAQILGSEKSIDVMEYSGIIDGENKTAYCVNMFNIGFDCNVVEMARELKKKPLISGPAAYFLSIFGKFVEKEGVNLKVEEIASGGERHLLEEGKLLLCAISNGSYCGGGIKSAPQSIVDDGYFDVNMVKDVSRGKFLKFLPAYKKGTHLNKAGVEEILDVRKSKSIVVSPGPDSLEEGKETFNLCVDGEVFSTTGIEIRIREKALKFILPAKMRSL